jgi:ankyrin repeat protein
MSLNIPTVPVSAPKVKTPSLPPEIPLTKSQPIRIPVKKDQVSIQHQIPVGPVQTYILHGKHEGNIDAQRMVETAYESIEPDDLHKLAKAAVKGQDDGLIQALGRSGYNFNAPNKTLGRFETHLTHAIFKNKPQAVRALIRAGADVNTPPELGNPPIQTALYAAEHEGHFKVLQALLEGQPALDEEQAERVQRLASGGKLKKLLTKSLLKAAEDGNRPLIKYLLETVRLEPTVSIGKKWNVATVAARNGHEEIRKQFEALGCINHFREQVARFAHEMLDARGHAEKKEALFNLLTAKYAAPEPKKTTTTKHQEDELPFPME